MSAARNIRRYYGAFLSALTAAVGVLFLWQICDLYFTGGAEPYTAVRIGVRLRLVAAPFFVWVAAVVAGIVIREAFPVSERTSPDAHSLYLRLRARMPKAGSGTAYERVLKEERAVRLLKWLAFAICVAGAAFAIIYLATPANFQKDAADKTPAIREMAYHVFPVALACLGCVAAVAVFEQHSEARQVVYLKKMRGVPVKKESAFPAAKVRLVVRIAVAAAAVCFIVVGVVNGGMHDVLIKAINICTECIGLG